MRRRFVEELNWIEEQEMLDLIAIAQSSPGAIAVNASILVGYRVAGAAGALLTVMGTVLPPLAIISVISLVYQQFRDNTAVNMLMAGMLCGVAAVIFDVVINMARPFFQKKEVSSVLVLLASFFAVRFFNVNIIMLIIACGFLGAVKTLRKKKERAKAEK